MIKPINTAISGIRRAGNTALEYGVKKPLKALSKAGFMDDICEAYQKDKMNIITGIGVGSIVLKDGYGCYLYVKQSLHNDKIPADKRKFVAGIDLANGILNVITQLTLGLCINKWSDKLYDRVFKGGFTPSAAKIKTYTDKVNAFLKKSELTENLICSSKNVKDAINKTNKIARGGFGVIAVLIVTQIIAKRMIVPFLSTPLAGVFKKQLDKREAKKKGLNPEEAQTQNANKPQQNNAAAAQTQSVIPQSDSARETFKGFEQFLKK